MKKFFRILKRILLALIVVWLIAVQGCDKWRTPDKTAVEDFKKAGVTLTAHTENINGHKLHYVATGSDTLPALIFVHGSPGSWNAFEAYLKDSDLLKHFYIISIDRPGFGYSDFGDAEHMNKQCEIVSVVLHKLKHNKPMFLVGHSLGGPLVVELADKNPDLVNGLVLLAGSVDPKAEDREIWRNIIAYSPLRYLVPPILRTSNDELMYFKKDVMEMPVMLPEIRCRVYIIQGDHDSLVPYENSFYAKSELTNATSVEMITLPGADHFIPWSNYEDIKKVLMKLNQ